MVHSVSVYGILISRNNEGEGYKTLFFPKKSQIIKYSVLSVRET